MVSVLNCHMQIVYKFPLVFRSGLLGGHLMALHVNKSGTAMRWYNNELLRLASDLGRRLLPAFNTSTGMPFPRVSCFFIHFV